MRTVNETIPVKIRAEFWSIFKNCAIGINGPTPICIIFLTISLLSSLFFLKTIDNKKIKADEKININTFKKSKLFRKSINKFKVLSNGNFKSKIDIEADYSSKTAKEKIEKAGGQITFKKQS